MQMYSNIPWFKATSQERRCLDSVLLTWTSVCRHMKPLQLNMACKSTLWQVCLGIMESSKFCKCNVPCKSGDQAVWVTCGFDVKANSSNFAVSPQHSCIWKTESKIFVYMQKNITNVATWGEGFFYATTLITRISSYSLECVISPWENFFKFGPKSTKTHGWTD